MTSGHQRTGEHCHLSTHPGRVRSRLVRRIAGRYQYSLHSGVRTWGNLTQPTDYQIHK